MDQSLAVRQTVSLVTNDDANMARKIKMLLPYGNKLTDDNALALAAYSRLHGLDPFNGECYFLVKEKKDSNTGEVISREEMGVYPGIKGKRKKANEILQAIDPGATYKVDYLVVGPDALGLNPKPGEISVIVQAELRDSISTDQYLRQRIELQKAQVPYEEIKTILGKPPIWIGFGMVKTSELSYIKQSPLTLAKKRAESEATNQRFHLPFTDDALADDIAPEMISEGPILEGEVLPQKTTDQISTSSQENSKKDNGNDHSNGEKASRPYPPELLKKAVKKNADAWAKKNKDFTPTSNQVNLLRYGLELCFEAGDPEVDDKRHTLLFYLTGHESTKDIDGKTFHFLVEEWLKMKPLSTGEYEIDPMAKKEAQAIIDIALKDEGQLSFS
jgi:hypothetical protein